MSFLTSLRAAFKGGAQGRVPLARNFVSPWQWAFERGGTRLPFEYRHAVRHSFLENPVAQRAVRIVADGVGSAPLAACDAKARALVMATSAGQSLLETLAAQLLLHGNAFVQVAWDGAGKPVELFALRPERVSVIPDADGWPAAYAYTIGDRKLTIPVEDEEGWPNLIHLKGYHPADDHYGAGWCRRSRGSWLWLDGVDLPLNEQAEVYVVGIGDSDAPDLRWEASAPLLDLDASSWASIRTAHSGKPLWVRQIGTAAPSPPLLLLTIA